MGCSPKTRTKQHENQANKASNSDNKMIIWFEVDDTGCGMNRKASLEKQHLKLSLLLQKKKQFKAKS